MGILFVIAWLAAVTKAMEVQHSLGSECSAIGQYVLHPTNRCQYVHCVYNTPLWGSRRSEFIGVARLCPHGTAVPNKHYLTPGGYRTFHLGAICSDWVANPYWRGGVCQVNKPNQQMESSDLHVRYARPQTFPAETIQNYASANEEQKTIQKHKSPSYKKAYDDGGYYRPEVIYDMENSQLEDREPAKNVPYEAEPVGYNNVYDNSVYDDRNYYNNDLTYSDNSDYYVMEQEAGKQMLQSVSDLDPFDETEFMSADESRKMKAHMIAMGYGRI